MKRCVSFMILLLAVAIIAYAPPVLRTWINSTFGELRMGFGPHFHMGVDFSTWEGNPRSGIKITAVEDGYLERIEIDPDDLYGCVVVLKHPSGYKTVYAHLGGFSRGLRTSTGADISAILDDLLGKFGVSEEIWKRRLEEMRRRSKAVFGQAFEPFTNEDELYPLCFEEGWAGKPRKITVRFAPNEVRVRQGEVIGFSGASGNVQGPHCHFEVRSSDEKVSYDPFGVYPDILRWIERPVRNEIAVEKLAIDGKIVEYSPDEVYEFEGDYPRISILAYSDYAVRGYSYRLGLRGITVSLDGNVLYEISFDEIPRDEFDRVFYVYNEKLSRVKGKYEAWYDLFPKGDVDVVKVNSYTRLPDFFTLSITLFDYFGNEKTLKLHFRRK